MNRHYAVYARQSIDKSDSISIETQIERCLFEVGDAPYTVYSDRGYSGKNTDRPQFQQMLEAVQTGEVSCVVCYKLDRCSRSILDFARLMDLFQQYDVAFISCTEKFDTATPMGRAMLNICIVFAQLERETIQQRITDAYHSRCKKGYFMGGRIPFGFSLKPYFLDGKKTSCYEVINEEAEILRQIYSIYKDPTASLSDVVLSLNASMTSNPRRPDGLWVRPHIGRMIKNPIYVKANEEVYDYYCQQNVIPDNPREDYIGQNGCYLYKIGNEKHLVLAPHEGIIPAQIWLQCQMKRSESKSSRKSGIPSSWLTGKLVCKKCGRAIITRKTTGKNGEVYRYFLCPGSRGKSRNCEGFKPFQAQKTERQLWAAILGHLKSVICGKITIADPISKLWMYLQQRYQFDLSQEQLKDILSNPLECSNTNTLFPNTQTDPASQLIARLSKYDSISLEKRARIADLLFESVKLTNDRVTIAWRV